MRTVALLATLAATAIPLCAQIPGGGAGASDLSTWNMQFAVPSGWQVVRTTGRLQVLASNTEAGAIFVAPGLYADFNQVGVDVSAFFSAMNMAAQPIEQVVTTQINGMQAMTGTYGSYDQTGQVVLSRGVRSSPRMARGSCRVRHGHAGLPAGGHHRPESRVG